VFTGRSPSARVLVTGSRDAAIVRAPPPKETMRKILGAALAIAVVIAVAALFALDRRPSSAESTPTSVVSGVIGSEKEDFFADPDVVAALAAHDVTVDVDTAGSRQIATETDLSGYDFAFPSSAPAAERIARTAGTSDLYSPFQSPMAIATWRPVIELLARNGAASQEADGTWTVDVNAYLALVAAGARWNTLDGGAELYGSPRAVMLTSTDVRRSNSAAMYLAIAAYVANGRSVPTTTQEAQALVPTLAPLFLGQGWAAASSEEPFADYLSQGSGAVPAVVVYEAQFLAEAGRENSRITDDMVLAYPAPTVFSKHTLVPLTPEGARVGELLSTDPELQRLAAEHGFRSGDGAAFTDLVGRSGVAVRTNPTDVAELPTYDVLESLLTAVETEYGQ
jgi:hypothetical protein